MMKSVAVITPATSNPMLLDAVESVATQTYPNVCHHIVCNGTQHFQAIMKHNLPQGDKLKINAVADNTAMPDHPNKHQLAQTYYNGHRVYAGYAHLVNSDYIAFLDEDDWFTPDHVASLIDTIESGDLHFAYALRKLYDRDRHFLEYDNTESLGKWPTVGKPYHAHLGGIYKHANLITTSCYLFRRDFLVNVAHLWHYGYGADLRFSDIMINHNKQVKLDTNGKYTLCYRIDSVDIPDRIPFIMRNVVTQRQRYPNGFPWAKEQVSDHTTTEEFKEYFRSRHGEGHSEDSVVGDR